MFRKSISIFMAACMLLTCFSSVSFAEEAQEQNETSPGVILDAQFSAEDNGGFELLNPYGDDGSGRLVTEPYAEGSDNYVLKFSASAHNDGATASNGGAEHIVVKLNGDDGIEFVDGRNIIIETKFKKSNTAARAYFKYNINPKDNYKEETANLFSILAVFEDGTVRYANGTSQGAADQVGMENPGLAGYDTSWIAAKTVIKGASLLSDTYLYNEDGELVYTITDASLKQPTGRTSLDSSDSLYIEEATHLKTLAFRARKGASDILVDYIKVSTQDEAAVEVPGIMSLAGEFDVGFDSYTMPANIADYFKLYNSDNELVSPEITAASGKLSFRLNSVLNEGDTYTLKVDKASFEAAGYIFEDETTDYTITASKYIINDEFGDGDLNGWALRTSGFGTLATELIPETDNYALKLGLISSGYIWQNNNYAYKVFDDIAYEDGVDIVIRTKFKYTDTNTGTEDAPNTTYARTYFKLNVPYDDEKYGSNVFSFFEVKGDNGFAVANGNSTTATGVFTTDYTSDSYKGDNKAAVDGQWFDTTIKIHGKTQTAAIYVTDEAGNVVVNAEEADLSQDASYTGFATDALKNLAFRLRHDLSYAWVDYVKVYKEKPATVTVPEIMPLDGSFDVTFDAADAPANIADYFELYDELGARVEDAEVTVSGNKISFALSETQTEGAKYTLKVNKALLTAIGYVFDNDTTEYDITASEYYINEAFGDGDNGGFELLNQLSASGMTVEPIEENSSNYVLKYSAANHTLDGTAAQGSDEHIRIKVNGDAGIEYREGKNIIVETRFKKTPDAGRAYFKHNINVDEPNEEGYNLYTIAAIFNGSSDGVRYPAKFSDTNTAEKVQVGVEKISSLYYDYNDKYLTVKAVIKGNTHKADLYFYDQNGENEVIITDAELGIPTGRENNVNDTHLKTLAFRTRNAATDVYVDYIKVYEQMALELDFDGKIIDGNGNMFIWANDDALDVIKPYVQLVDSENSPVEITTAIKGDGSLEIDPVNSLAAGTYTLKVDTTELETYAIPVSSATVEVRDSTLSYNESFDGTHDWALNTFTMGENTDAAQTIETEGENNFLRVSLTKQGSLKNGVTTAYKFGENGFVMDSEGYTVIEARLRSSGSNFRKYFKFNTDYTNGFFANTRTLFAFDFPTTGTLAYVAHRQNIKSDNESAYYQGAGTAFGEYTPSQWYTVRAIFDNRERSARYYMLDENGAVVAESPKISMSAPEPQDFTQYGAAGWYNFADHNLTDREQLRYIDELAFVLRNTPTGLTEAETLDIDDVKLYNTNNLAGLVADEAKVGLKKDGAVFEGELTAGTYYPTADIELASGEADDFVLIGVLYNGGTVEELVVHHFSGAKGEFTSDKGLVVSDATNREIKVFLWDSLSSLTPVCELAEFG